MEIKKFGTLEFFPGRDSMPEQPWKLYEVTKERITEVIASSMGSKDAGCQLKTFILMVKPLFFSGKPLFSGKAVFFSIQGAKIL